MEPNVADTLNEEIKVIWNKFLSKDKTELHPVYFKPISETQITFVGMNPSFNKKGITKTIKNEGAVLDNADFVLLRTYEKEPFKSV